MGEDEKIIEQLQEPKTLGMLDVPYSMKTLQRRVKRLVDAKKMFIVGTEQSNGRPRNIYCAKKIKNPDHELHITKVTKHWEADFLRGNDVDKYLLPDFQLRRLCGEMDEGTENLNQVKGRLQKYMEAVEFPLFVCPSERRMRNILSIGYDFVLATTLVEALTPDPKCWDCNFKEYRVIEYVKLQVEFLKRDKDNPNQTKDLE